MNRLDKAQICKAIGKHTGQTNTGKGGDGRDVRLADGSGTDDRKAQGH